MERLMLGNYIALLLPNKLLFIDPRDWIVYFLPMGSLVAWQENTNDLIKRYIKYASYSPMFFA